MSSTKTIELMDLEEAMKNKNLLGGELENISKNQEENVAALTGMLYSIPKSVTKNRDIHKMFLGDNFKDEDDENDDPESNKKISIEGQNLRDILTKKEKSKSEDNEKDDKENEDIEEDDDDYDNEEDDDESENIAEGKDVNAEKKEIVSEYTSSDETKEENFEKSYDYYKNTQEDKKDEKDEKDEENEEPSEEKIIELINKLGNKMKAKGESEEKIEKCMAVLLLMLLADYDNLDLYENDMKDLIDKLYENDLNSQNGEENPKKVTITDEKKSKKDSEKSRDIATQGTYGMATEDDMKDLTDNLSENDLNSQNDEKNPKKVTITDEKKSKKDSEEATWQDDSDMDNDEAEILRKKARKIATQGEYGMATKDGIEKLSELLNELLKYSSGHFRKNKPIAELVRNFNSIKAIESQLVGNEKSLKIVASEKDLEKVAKSAKNTEEDAKSAKAKELTKARMLRLSMEQTYADKIRALDRFKYSEKVETMIRNALFDLYENSKVVKIKTKENGNYVYEEKLENEKAINTGKILLPLLRTKNEPKDYNYDFQYDVLREMIRQEEFYDENHDSDPYEKDLDKHNGNKKVKVTPIGVFAILRYLRTILNYTNKKIGNTDASASDLYETECFKTNFVKTLQNIINNNNSSTKDDKLNDDNSDYQKYMRALQKIVEENKELGPALSNANEIILSLYNKTKKYLKEKKNNIDLRGLISSLRKLSETLDDFSQGNIIPQLNEKISRIANAISGNLNFEKILITCGYKDEKEEIKKLDKELQQKTTTKTTTKTK